MKMTDFQQKIHFKIHSILEFFFPCSLIFTHFKEMFIFFLSFASFIIIVRQKIIFDSKSNC